MKLAIVFFSFIKLVYFYTQTIVSQPMILCIETSTQTCSAALHDLQGLCIASDADFQENYSHAEKLVPMVQRLAKKSGRSLSQLKAVALSIGPGSYTGLRIGSSTAKGLCFGLNIPLIGLDTLAIMCQDEKVQNSICKNDVLIPLLDARRMEVYINYYDGKGKAQREVNHIIIDQNTFKDEFIDKRPVLFGNGANKCKDVLLRKEVLYIDDVHPLAKNMGFLAVEKYNAKQWEDLAYFQPLYLKEFVAKKAKKLI